MCSTMSGEKMRLNLKKYRKSKNLSQVELANSSGLSIDVIRSLECGRLDMRNSKADTLLKLADVLSCTVDDLLLEDKKMPKKMVLKEQFTEENYSIEELLKMCIERMASARKNKEVVELISQKPVYDKKGDIIDVTEDFPAELNIYVLQDDE